MENRFKITDEMMDKAKTYIPLAKKEALVRLLAPSCIRESYDMDPDFQPVKNAADEMLPPMYEEDGASKSRILLSLMLYWYFGEDTKDYLCPLEIYDGWGESHILNQIERYKAGPYKTTAYDMLSDYRDMEKRLNAAVYALIKRKNDPVNRLAGALSLLTQEETLERLQARLQNAASSLQEAAQQALDEKGDGQDG